MDFTLTPEQQLLSDGLGKFLSARYDLATSREAAKVGAGWQPEIWRAFADELGVLGACLPESVGGADGGAEELMVVAESLGHALVVEPFVDSVVLGARLLARTDSPRAHAAAEQIAEGNALSAAAFIEDGSGLLHHVATRAEKTTDGWVLTGAKPVVTTAPLAAHLLVSARTSGDVHDRDGVSLFLIDLSDGVPEGLTMTTIRTIDDRRAADLTLDGLRVDADALMGGEGQALPLLEQAWDEATAAVVSEAVGAMRKVLGDTVEYTKQRQQFGQPIGSFQVLQHRMVDMFIELEQAVAAQYLAILALDAPPAERAAAVSAAKATISRAARFIGQNAVQLHGGMGMTEELAIGHYFRRLTAVEYEFGSADAHLARFARLSPVAD